MLRRILTTVRSDTRKVSLRGKDDGAVPGTDTTLVVTGVDVLPFILLSPRREGPNGSTNLLYC